MPEDIPREADPWTPSSRIVVLVRRVISRPSQPRDTELAGALAVDEGILPTIAQLGIEIADVAFVVVESAENFRSQPQVQREIGSYLPIILNEKSVVVVTVSVIEHSAAAKTAGRRSFQEVLEIGHSVG